MEQQPFGEFREGGRVFRVTQPQTPRPLMNYLWNSHFLSAVNHFGTGQGAYGGRAACYIDPENRGRAALIRDGNRFFYLRDGDTGSVWNPGWYPTCHPLDGYWCDHGPGTAVICGSLAGVEAQAEVFVPEEHPCEAWTLTLRNLGGVEKTVEVFSCVEFSLEGYSRYSEYDSYVRAFYDEERRMVYAQNRAQERPHPWYDGFIASDLPPEGYETSKRRFFGAYGGPQAPWQLRDGQGCTNQGTACEEMVGVLCHRVTLAPGGSWRLRVLIGSCDQPATAAAICGALWPQDFGRLRREAEERCAAQARTSQIKTPEPRLDSLFNHWLKRQVAMCAEVGRSTGKGFRDTLQDSMALCTFQPRLAREKIVETLSHQYSDGRCPRGWLPVDPHIYSDGPVWIAPAVNAYLKETGDFDLLWERVPYLDGGSATVWEHVLLAARYSAGDVGAHGLVLAHDGDWNDSLNGIGVGGQGESVWTSIALCGALADTLELARHFDPNPALLDELECARERMLRAVRIEGWDGAWFLAGYDDEGRPVGSHREEEGKIYLNPQTWAVLTGTADGEQTRSCLAAVDRWLDCADGALTLYPPYTHYQPAIGRLTGFIPGIWENGAPYCHGGMFKVVTDFASGRVGKGWETLLKILPDSPGNPSVHSGCEPYVFTNMYLGPDNPRAGETTFAWVTGTAGWAQRAVTEYLFGFKPSYDGFRLVPALPDGFDGAELTRSWRGAVYHIRFYQGEPGLTVDGKALPHDGLIPVGERGKAYEIEVSCPLGDERGNG